jgi:acyl-coenzyme A synthetase/AMP-(fatty) acid ligase
MLNAFLAEPNVSECQALRRVVCSGEALPFSTQQQFFEKLPTALYNLYGPTEAAIDVTAWSCRRDDRSGRVPIGHPIANTEIYMLDADLNLVPPGVPGQIHIGGLGLARGYLNHPALTASSFIPDPFSGRSGARMYATCDLGRRLRDGAVEYLGRTDRQVKIHGVRIEPGEIEATLLKHPSVRQAVVVPRHRSGETQLVAYIVTEGEVVGLDALRRWLGTLLPPSMIPSHLVFLRTLPVTGNGKLDHRLLPELEDVRPAIETPFVPPRTPLEEKVATLWTHALQLTSVGVHDNFFDIGGHSLLLMQLASRIRETFNVDVPLSVLFSGPTVAEMAVAVLSQQLESVPPDVAARLFTEIAPDS